MTCFKRRLSNRVLNHGSNPKTQSKDRVRDKVYSPHLPRIWRVGGSPAKTHSRLQQKPTKTHCQDRKDKRRQKRWSRQPIRPHDRCQCNAIDDPHRIMKCPADLELSRHRDAFTDCFVKNNTTRHVDHPAPGHSPIGQRLRGKAVESKRPHIHGTRRQHAHDYSGNQDLHDCTLFIGLISFLRFLAKKIDPRWPNPKPPDHLLAQAGCS